MNPRFLCPFGCQDLDFGQDESTVTETCVCTPEEIVRGIERFNTLGISVEFVAD